MIWIIMIFFGIYEDFENNYKDFRSYLILVILVIDIVIFFFK